MLKISLSVVLSWSLLLVLGCSHNAGEIPNPTSNSVPVSLSMTDDPPSGVNVLLFELSLTAATLTPASGSSPVSLLTHNKPIPINVTQLQTLSAFLDVASIPSGAYNSLNLTFASPHLVILNTSDQAIASTCPLNTICSLTPQLDNSPSIALSSAPFPITVSQNAPLGFLVDFHLNNVIQSDLSISLSAGNGITVSQMPSPAVPSGPTSGPSLFGFLSGTVQNINTSQNQFMLQSASGSTFTLDVNSNTVYQSFPPSACTTSSFSCIHTGQNVQVQVANVNADGTLVAAEVSHLQAAGQQSIVGDVLNVNTANGSTVVELLLHSSPNGSALPGIGYVTVPSTATFSIDAGSFTIPSGFRFASSLDLVLGQEVTVDVAAGTLNSQTGSGLGASSVSFTTDRVTLEPVQLTNKITALDSATRSFTIDGFSNCFPSGCTSSAPITVDTTSQTAYQGLTPDSFSGLTIDGLVSIQGWLFSTPAAAMSSTMVAQTVVGRTADGY